MFIFLVIVFLVCLAYHTYTDLKDMILYDWVNVVLAIGGALYAYIGDNLVDSIYGCCLGFIVMCGIFVLGRGNMGLGDVKFMCCLGLWLGYEKTIETLFIAVALGVIVGISFIFMKGKKIDAVIPFGPFLSLGALISFFYGSEMLWF